MITIGILGCAEIAFRRFMPAANNVDGIHVKVIAEEYDISKLQNFEDAYGIETADSFKQILARDDIDAVYIPQPPALHFQWAKRALESGKHVLVEKPSTTAYEDTKVLVNLAREKGLALHENYMFQYHSQITEIEKMLADGKVGDVRLIRADFGFPLRAQNDFRYNKRLGGGALLDAGGYTIKLATRLLGGKVQIDTSTLSGLDGYEVDMYGSATLSNDRGTVCQIGFGMDCAYRCSLEVWGSKGTLYTNRIFTAPSDYQPVVVINTADGEEEIRLSADAHFEHSIELFCKEIADIQLREKVYEEILTQSKLVNEFIGS